MKRYIESSRSSIDGANEKSFRNGFDGRFQCKTNDRNHLEMGLSICINNSLC